MFSIAQQFLFLFVFLFLLLVHDWLWGLLKRWLIKNVPKSPVKPAIFSTTVCLNRVCHFLIL